MSKISLYIITNIKNNKVYIGYTSWKDVGKYWKRHLEKAQNNSTRYFYRSLKKYGKDNFTFEIISQFDTINEAKRAEVWTIFFYKSNICRYGKNFGYNMTDGGDGISGHVVSKETKQKISKSHIGMKLSKETKQKISNSNKGRASGTLGKVLSKETRQKQSLAKVGKISHKRGKSKISKQILDLIKIDRNNRISFRQIGIKYGFVEGTIRYALKKSGD